MHATTPAALATEWGVSERRIRSMARRLGACRVFGKTMVLLPEDVAVILEAARPCPSSSIEEVKSGTTEAPLPDVDYEEARARLTRQQRNASRPRKKTGSGKVISMDRRRS